MSLCLYSKGIDIFMDPGMYNFLYRHPMRDYMESMAAHTTVGIKDCQYSIASGNGRKFKILYQKTQRTTITLFVAPTFTKILQYIGIYTMSATII